MFNSKFCLRAGFGMLLIAPVIIGGCPDPGAGNPGGNTNTNVGNTNTNGGTPQAEQRDPLPANQPTGIALNTSNRFQRTNLTYFVRSYSPRLDQARQDQLIADAFGRWSAVTPLNFTRVNAAPADFVIGFGTGTHCELYANTRPTEPFEPTTLGHAYFPNQAEQGQCHMNSAFDDSNERLLFSTLVHELGHNLGLDHLPAQSAVMFADDNGQTGTLQADDIAYAQRLYGSRDGTIRPEAAAAPPATDAAASRTAPTTSLPDADGDGLDDATERFALGTNPAAGDGDGDGLGDGVEAVAGLEPRDADSDGDGTSDGDEFDGDGNAFRPDFANPGDVSALVGKYTGSDSNGAAIESTIAADGSVTGKISLMMFGFAEDLALLGAANNQGRAELVTNDYFFELEGNIANGALTGSFVTETGGEGTWSATRGVAQPRNAFRPDFGLYAAQR